MFNEFWDKYTSQLAILKYAQHKYDQKIFIELAQNIIIKIHTIESHKDQSITLEDMYYEFSDIMEETEYQWYATRYQMQNVMTILNKE